MLIDSPIEADLSCCGCLAGLLTRASSNLSCLPRDLAPVAWIASVLRAYSGGAAPDSHRLPILTRQLSFVTQTRPPVKRAYFLEGIHSGATQFVFRTSRSLTGWKRPRHLRALRPLSIFRMAELVWERSEADEQIRIVQFWTASIRKSKSHLKQPVERNVQWPWFWRRSVTDSGGTSMRQKDCGVAWIAWMIAARMTAGCVTATL
jgi:hypothetical protein